MTYVSLYVSEVVATGVAEAVAKMSLDINLV